MASGLAKEMGKIATVGLGPEILDPWMNITRSTLANWWRRKAIKGNESEVEGLGVPAEEA